MHITKHWRGAALLTAGLLVGYMIGPPIAEAAASLVKIEGCCNTATAGVNATTHRLAVGTSSGQDSIFAVTEPSGETILASGSTGVAKSTGTASGDIVGISLDVSSAGSSPVTLILRESSLAGQGQIIWQGTVQNAGHIDYTFGQSIFICGTVFTCAVSNPGFNTTVVNAGGASVQYEVFGFGFGAHCCLSQSRAAAPPGS